MMNRLLGWVERKCRSNVVLYYYSRRAYFYFAYFTGSAHEPEFRVLKHLPSQSGLLLDIGANDGLSVISMRRFAPANPILSVEPNPFHFEQLKRVCKKYGHSSHRACAVADSPGMLTLYVPVFHGYPLTALAALDRDDALDLEGRGMFIGGVDARELHVEAIQVSVERVDDWNLSPVFVKIDVEGGELAVLQGMRNTLERCKPILLIERNPHGFADIRRWLAVCDYLPVDPETLAEEPVEISRAAGNAVFLYRGKINAPPAA